MPELSPSTQFRLACAAVAARPSVDGDAPRGRRDRSTCSKHGPENRDEMSRPSQAVIEAVEQASGNDSTSRVRCATSSEMKSGMPMRCSWLKRCRLAASRGRPCREAAALGAIAGDWLIERTYGLSDEGLKGWPEINANAYRCAIEDAQSVLRERVDELTDRNRRAVMPSSSTPSRDEDFYVWWSTVVDAPIGWDATTSLRQRRAALERFARADERGTSANGPTGRREDAVLGWNVSEWRITNQDDPKRPARDGGYWTQEPARVLRRRCRRARSRTRWRVKVGGRRVDRHRRQENPMTETTFHTIKDEHDLQDWPDSTSHRETLVTGDLADRIRAKTTGTLVRSSSTKTATKAATRIHRRMGLRGRRQGRRRGRLAHSRVQRNERRRDPLRDVR